MQDTTKLLMQEVSGCTFAYTQSDEISLLISDYKKIGTQPWFDYKIQKMVSIAASMCTAYFNMSQMVHFGCRTDKLAFFDARVYNLPREEVVNYFIWRQQDCSRNSIQMVGQANFSHKELQNKSCSNIQDMLHEEKGVNWNDYPTFQKRGTGLYKKKSSQCPKCKIWPFKSKDGSCDKCGEKNIVNRTEVFIDKDIPIFSKDRDFIQKWVDIDKEV
jgi:tRNA(His) 5'-end guanylyltransferase